MMGSGRVLADTNFKNPVALAGWGGWETSTGACQATSLCAASGIERASQGGTAVKGSAAYSTSRRSSLCVCACRRVPNCYLGACRRSWRASSTTACVRAKSINLCAVWAAVLEHSPTSPRHLRPLYTTDRDRLHAAQPLISPSNTPKHAACSSSQSTPLGCTKGSAKAKSCTSIQ